MAIPFDAASWVEERIQEELEGQLPPGWSVTLTKDPATLMWWVTVFEGEDERWKGDAAAPNTVLLHALGWAMTRLSKSDEAGPWAPRRREITKDRLHELAYRVSSPDPEPEDVDPEEVASVYKRRK